MIVIGYIAGVIVLIGGIFAWAICCMASCEIEQGRDGVKPADKEQP